MTDEPNKEDGKQEQPRPPITRIDFEAAIIKKAWEDPAYKKRLLNNPKEVVEEALQTIRPGAKIPDNVEIYVHEETPGAIHIALPMNPAEIAGNGEAAWINEVAGGVMGVAVTVVVAVAGDVVLVGNTVGAVNVAGVGNTVGAVNVAGVGNMAGAGNVMVAVNVSSTVNMT